MPLEWLSILKNGAAPGTESAIFLEAACPQSDWQQAVWDQTVVRGHGFIPQIIRPPVRTQHAWETWCQDESCTAHYVGRQRT